MSRTEINTLNFTIALIAEFAAQAKAGIQLSEPLQWYPVPAQAL